MEDREFKKLLLRKEFDKFKNKNQLSGYESEEYFEWFWKHLEAVHNTYNALDKAHQTASDQIQDFRLKLSERDELIKAAMALEFSLKYIFERAIESKGACYISSMERGDIERALEHYQTLKSKQVLK